MLQGGVEENFATLAPAEPKWFQTFITNTFNKIQKLREILAKKKL